MLNRIQKGKLSMLTKQQRKKIQKKQFTIKEKIQSWFIKDV